MPIYTKQLGEIKEVKRTYVRIGGQWEQATKGLMKVYGEWKELFYIPPPPVTRWVPNFTGHTYLSFDNWSESVGKVSLTFYIEKKPTRKMFLIDGSSLSSPHFTVDLGGVIDYDKMTNCMLNGKPIASGTSIPAGIHTLEFNISRLGRIDRIGGSSINSDLNFIGQIYNITMINENDSTDTNNRGYPCVVEQDLMPTHTEIVNTLGDTFFNATIKSPASEPWTLLIDTPPEPPPEEEGVTIGTGSYDGYTNYGFIQAGSIGKMAPTVVGDFEITRLSYADGRGTYVGAKYLGTPTGTEYILEILVEGGRPVTHFVFDNDPADARISSRDLCAFKGREDQTIPFGATVGPY